MAATEVLTPHLPKIRVPTDSDKVYKDECVFSFDTPDTDTGLYVSLSTFIGLGRDFVDRYFHKTGNAVFLHMLRHKREIPIDQQGDGPEKKITRLAIGIEGGFDSDCGKKKYEYEEQYSVVVLPNFITFPWPSSDLPEIVAQSVRAVLEAESATKLAELEALTGTWDGEVRIVSKHAANLMQLDNGKKIPPSGWKCEHCDLTENLWLNLTDGSILCGRKFFDGSGGNNHAVEHFLNTNYPLAVKLGTITKEGKADVFSYDEDDMVEDPHLQQHLAHFGINIAIMEKTDKSMVELELKLNQQVGEWSTLQEAGSHLSLQYGPGYTGLCNLGNSCYLNSIMQVIFSIPDFCRRFVDGAPAIFQSAGSDPATDFNVQMAKLGVGLLSGKYSHPPAEPAEVSEESQPGISPSMFKYLISKGHPEFSSKRQQDAQEFFMHLVNTLEKHSRHQENPSECFKFSVEDRFQCSATNKVKYAYRAEYSLPLSIPLDTATNKEEVAAYKAQKAEMEARGQHMDPNKIVRPRIKLSSCLEAFIQPELITGFYSSALKQKTTAQKTMRLSTFPDYLMLHLKKFCVQDDWKPMKLDVAVEMPDIIDLAALRGSGLQPGEELLPEATETPQPVLNEDILSQLSDMGFPLEACKKAVYFSDNAGVEEATSWLMTHISDSDFSDPFVLPGTDRKLGNKSSFMPNEESLGVIMSMGFTKPQATKALQATENNVERAIDWIFNHAEELDADDGSSTGASSEPKFRDGNSMYRLVAFISHMGQSSMVGHYVCHILKDGNWIIFNDNKVALSENPPKELGYLYLYKRM